MKIRVDDTDSSVARRYVREANCVLDNTVGEVQLICDDCKLVTSSNLSPMDVFQVFSPDTLLQKLKLNINRVLKLRKSAVTTFLELKEVLVIHVLAASYNSNVSTKTDPGNKDFSGRECQGLATVRYGRQ